MCYTVSDELHNVFHGYSMHRPNPLKNAECECCLVQAPLLMPVGFAPGWPVIVWQRMCLACRLNTASDSTLALATDLQHARRAETRAAYHRWLDAAV